MSTEKPSEYKLTSLRKPEHVADMGRDALELHHVFGIDVSRRDNLAFIRDDTIIYANGNSVIFQNIYFPKKNYLLALDEGGVGCIGVHPQRFDLSSYLLSFAINN